MAGPAWPGAGKPNFARLVASYIAETALASKSRHRHRQCGPLMDQKHSYQVQLVQEGPRAGDTNPTGGGLRDYFD